MLHWVWCSSPGVSVNPLRMGRGVVSCTRVEEMLLLLVWKQDPDEGLWHPQKATFLYSTNPLCVVFTREVFMVQSLQNGIVSVSAASQHNWNTDCNGQLLGLSMVFWSSYSQWQESHCGWFSTQQEVSAGTRLSDMKISVKEGEMHLLSKRILM